MIDGRVTRGARAVYLARRMDELAWRATHRARAVSLSFVRQVGATSVIFVLAAAAAAACASPKNMLLHQP